jgi:hypothetical protein
VVEKALNFLEPSSAETEQNVHTFFSLFCFLFFVFLIRYQFFGFGHCTKWLYWSLAEGKGVCVHLEQEYREYRVLIGVQDWSKNG